MTTEDLLNEIQFGIDGVLNLVDHLEVAQGDEGGADEIVALRRELDAARAVVDDIVP